MTVAEDLLILYVRNEANTANPQLLSATPPTQLNSRNSTRFNAAEFGGLPAGRLGYRVYWGGSGTSLAVQATADISGYQFIKAGGVLQGDCTQEWDTITNGGVQFILFDTNNNYIGWNILGRDLVNFRGDRNRNYLVSGDDGSAINSPRWIIKLSEPPDIQSPTPIDLSVSHGYEVHVNSIDTYRNGRSFAMGGVYAFNPEVCTDAVTTEAIFDRVISSKDSYLALFQHLYGDNLFFAGNAGKISTLMYGFQIGDGVSQTTANIVNETLIFTAPIESPTAIALEYPYTVGLNASNRILEINQSASDIVVFDRVNIQAVDDVAGGTATIEVKGEITGSFTYLNGTARGIDFILNHGDISDVTFNSCYGLAINDLVSITGCSYRNAPEGNGLEITSGAGDYSVLDLTFNNNTGFDLTLGSGGAGLYDLTSLKITSGYTLKIYNNSLNDIEIALSAIANTVTTDGGNVTIVQPRNSGTVDGLIANSRIEIFNRTTATELVNQIEPTTIFTYDYDEGVEITAGDILDIFASNTQGTVGYRVFQGVATAQVTGFSATALQIIDPIYEENAIDGSTVTDFDANFPNIELINNITITTLPRLYAWYIDYLYTADGLRNWVGILTASDVSNYQINVDVADAKLDNTNNVQAFFEGNRVLTRSDGTSPILTTTTSGYGISISPSRVNTVSVAGGGGSLDQSTYNNLMLNVPTSTKDLYKATSFSLEQTNFDSLMSGVDGAIKNTYKADITSLATSTQATNISNAVANIPTNNNLSQTDFDAKMLALPTTTKDGFKATTFTQTNFNTLMSGVTSIIKNTYKASTTTLATSTQATNISNAIANIPTNNNLSQTDFDAKMLALPSGTKDTFKATSFSLDQTSFDGLMSGVNDGIKNTYKANITSLATSSQIDALENLSLTQIESSTVLAKVTDLDDLTVSIDTTNFNTLIGGVPDEIKETYRASVDNLDVNINLTPQQIREEIDNNSLVRKLLSNTNKLELVNNRYLVLDDDGVTPILTQETYNTDGERNSEEITEFRKV